MQALFGDVVYAYTWDDAVRDGLKVDVTAQAKELGYKWPVAVSRGIHAWMQPERNDYITRLIFLLLKGLQEIKKAGSEDDRIYFTIAHKNVVLAIDAKADGSPALSFFLPEED